MLRLSKFLSISLWIISSLVIGVYGNYLMLYRPNYKIPESGLVYPFPGKGPEIYISVVDYSVLLISALGLFLSVIVTNRLYKKK